MIVMISKVFHRFNNRRCGSHHGKGYVFHVAAFLFIIAGLPSAVAGNMKLEHSAAPQKAIHETPVVVPSTYRLTSSVSISRPRSERVTGLAVNGDTLALCSESAGVEVYARADGTWTRTARLLPSDGLDRHYYRSVAMNDEFIVVGLAARDLKTPQPELAYVFARPAEGWKGDVPESARLAPRENPEGAGVGSVAMAGDAAVIGVRGPRDGAVCVFEKPEAGWQGTVHETLSLPRPSDAVPERFGASVAASTEVIAVGESGENGRAGRVYVYCRSELGWKNVFLAATLRPSVEYPGDRFGQSVSVGTDEIAVGAPGDPEYGAYAGAAYVYAKPSGGWNGILHESAKLLAFDGKTGQNFGFSVSLEDGVAAVGTAETPDSVYVFEKPIEGWTGRWNRPEKVCLSPNAPASFPSVFSVSQAQILTASLLENAREDGSIAYQQRLCDITKNVDYAFLPFPVVQEIFVFDHWQIADRDTPNLQSAEVKIAENYYRGQDYFKFIDQSGIAGTFDFMTGTLLLKGEASVRAYMEAIQSVVFYSRQKINISLKSRTLSVSVSDGVLSSEPVFWRVVYPRTLPLAEPIVSDCISTLNDMSNGSDREWTSMSNIVLRWDYPKEYCELYHIYWIVLYASIDNGSFFHLSSINASEDSFVWTTPYYSPLSIDRGPLPGHRYRFRIVLCDYYFQQINVSKESGYITILPAVQVVDHPESAEDLSLRADVDPIEDRSLTVTWGFDEDCIPAEAIREYHVYVRESESEPYAFLGRALKDALSFEWKENGALTAAPFRRGPRFGHPYQFRVYILCDQKPVPYCDTLGPVNLRPPVRVTDDVVSSVDLSGGRDSDPENKRSLAVKWGVDSEPAPAEPVKEYHIYVKTDEAESYVYLARAPADATVFEWRSNGGSMTAKAFRGGPEFGHRYQFRVYSLTDRKPCPYADSPGPVWFESESAGQTPTPAADLPLPTPTTTPTPAETPTPAVNANVIPH